MYELYDTFNDRVISRHRTIKNAVRADIRFNRRIKKYHGQSSYIPTQILDSCGDPIIDGHSEYDQMWEAEAALS